MWSTIGVVDQKNGTRCLLDKLLGKKVVSLSRVVLENQNTAYRAVMDDTLVFHLSNEEKLELMTGQDSVALSRSNFFLPQGDAKRSVAEPLLAVSA